MDKWEYLLVPIPDKKMFGMMDVQGPVVNEHKQYNLQGLADIELWNRLGAEGWELVRQAGPNRPFHTFKRRIKPSE